MFKVGSQGRYSKDEVNKTRVSVFSLTEGYVTMGSAVFDGMTHVGCPSVSTGAAVGASRHMLLRLTAICPVRTGPGPRRCVLKVHSLFRASELSSTDHTHADTWAAKPTSCLGVNLLIHLLERHGPGFRHKLFETSLRFDSM